MIKRVSCIIEGVVHLYKTEDDKYYIGIIIEATDVHITILMIYTDIPNPIDIEMLLHTSNDIYEYTKHFEDESVTKISVNGSDYKLTEELKQLLNEKYYYFNNNLNNII
jgi:hypothetical protein